MNKLKNTTKLVKQVLETSPAARNDDKELYLHVLSLWGVDYLMDCPYAKVLHILEELGVPSMETVGRCRRKVQQEHPELKANAEVQGFRDGLEVEFREWAKAGD